VHIMSIVIGSFNIRDLNFSNESKDGEIQKRDFPLIANMIIKEGFDVVAIRSFIWPVLDYYGSNFRGMVYDSFWFVIYRIFSLYNYFS